MKPIGINLYASAVERKIAKRLVAAALDNGYLISVWDGEEFAERRRALAQPVLEALASTDADVLHFHHDGKYLGCMSLVWGNEEDLISDHSDNPQMNALAALAA